ncbi:precorrin-6A reductase [Cytobacillus sp. IB215665]|uniref:precorrin-6A reductase n=1 Tax=Cytobacillus sp. IB215665 TaxID=3097357 RepID=UPI002A153B87|nr:precorrin-6A reductase [Cytobacillus sp. IB215665]MDX8367329.1 precorrin-6A reductase [Cytobacillus sp. IB215665]
MILCLAGTSDARELAITLKNGGYSLLTTVVTDSAAIELRKAGLPIKVGRLNVEEMVEVIQLQNIETIVDASHPFAEEASRNAIQAARAANIPYIRYERQREHIKHEKIITVESYEQAAEVAASKGGVIMLTTGSKTLQVFAQKLLNLPNTRLITRMLPRKDNMEKCEQLGILQKNIVAIQGPFTKEFDIALYKQYGVTLMITKESGKVGSVDEKLAAAAELDIETIVIKRPSIEYGLTFSTFDEVLRQLNEMEVQNI